VDKPYDLKDWAARTTRGRQIFNFRYRMRDRDVRGWRLLKNVLMPPAQRATETIYLWKRDDQDDRALVRISIAELDDWRSAQRRLQETLGNCMRPAIPHGTGKLALIGDVNVVARDPQSDAPAALLFTRGNICVSVNSVGEVNIDVSKIASGIDRALAEPPSGAAQQKQRSVVKAPKSVTARAKKRVSLIKALSKSVPADSWLKIIAEDGEVSKKGDSLVYESPESGKKRMGIYAMRVG
jgi:hypothetical protein